MSFKDAAVLLNIQPAIHPLTVTLPDGRRICSTHTAILDLPQLPIIARHVDVFPEFVGSLLSTGTLCDSGLTAVYTATSVHFINDEGIIVLIGSRSELSKVWMVDISGVSTSAPSSGGVSSAGPHRFCRSPSVQNQSLSTPQAIQQAFYSSAVITEATGTSQLCCQPEAVQTSLSNVRFLKKNNWYFSTGCRLLFRH